ncbi:hypothetical protein B2J88_43265 [Rhodococcus sp. SRB_17]|nr:hypothetical protein [Rhodococcus sp. SRB_17]
METIIEEPRFLVEEFPDQIADQVFPMFVAGWSIRVRMQADEGRTSIELRASAPVDGVDDALVTIAYERGRWGADEKSTGLLSPDGIVSARNGRSVIEYMYTHVPAWLVPETAAKSARRFLDLHDRLADDDDPVLAGLFDGLAPMFEAMIWALGAGWEFTVTYRAANTAIEISTQVPPDHSDQFRLTVGDLLDVDVRDMRMHWTLRDGSWQLDPEATGFIGADASVDVAGLDTLCAVMQVAAANCALTTSDTSKQWHSGGAATPASVLPVIPPAPESLPEPDVIDARARAIHAWSAANGFSVPLEPTPAALIQFLEQAGAGPIGYYILEFTDGQCYIGESIDLPERLKRHRGRYRDIHRIRVVSDSKAIRSPHAKRHLRLRERSLIHGAQEAGLFARNINEMATMIGASKHLDDLISPDEQRIWLSAPDVANTNDTTVRESFSAERLARTAANYRHLRTHPDADQITRIIGSYLTRCVPYPARTELHSWAISCLTKPGKRSGRVSCLTIAMTETLVIYQNRGISGPGTIQVNADELFPTDQSVWEFLRRHPTAQWSPAVYEESGPGQLLLRVDTLDALERLLDDVAVTRAAATTALNIMRKGPCMQRKVHCPQLVGGAFDSGYEGNRSG